MKDEVTRQRLSLLLWTLVSLVPREKQEEARRIAATILAELEKALSETK